MNDLYQFYTEDDGSVRMTVPNNWIIWRNVMNNIDAKTFLVEQRRPILEEPGITLCSHYLQFRFETMEVAIQFKLKHL